MKHADLIKAACDGAVIQEWNDEAVKWVTFSTQHTAIHAMLNFPASKFQIKPADVVWYRAIYTDARYAGSFPSIVDLKSHLNLLIGIERITISPEGKLVSVEIVPESEWKPSDDGWIEWNGGECPVSAFTRVKVKMRDGTVKQRSANCFLWEYLNVFRPGDIIAYKVEA